jgi:hypothetical protein
MSERLSSLNIKLKRKKAGRKQLLTTDYGKRSRSFFLLRTCLHLLLLLLGLEQ